MGFNFTRSGVEATATGLPNKSDVAEVELALGTLRRAVDLIDEAGRGLAPHFPEADCEDLLDFSLELDRIATSLSLRAEMLPGANIRLGAQVLRFAARVGS